MDAALLFTAFAWGACWGSFLNVVIHRLPQDLSLVRPGSRCGTCLVPIKADDNIPIVSYFVLRGRCRACNTAYSPRYMLIEAACGVFALILWRTFMEPLDPDSFLRSLSLWLWWQTYVYLLIALTFIDLEHTILPNELTWPGIALGVAGPFLLDLPEPLDHVWGALAGGLFLLFIVGLGWVVFRREAMGMGDVFLLAMIGAWLGWRALPFVIFASSLQALLAAGATRLYTRITGRANPLVMSTAQLDERFGEEDRFQDAASHHVVPYGPFLALAGLEAMLFGVDLFWRLVDSLAFQAFAV